MFIKPISTSQDQKVTHLTVEANKAKNKDHPTLIDSQQTKPRIGAFEIQMMFKGKGNQVHEKIIYSKLKTNLWPSIPVVLEKIHFFLPIIPQVAVLLYRENQEANTYDEYNDDRQQFTGIEVKLKSKYTGTQSAQSLNHFLETNYQENLQRKLIERQQKIQSLQANAGNFNIHQSRTLRPSSAKTQLGSQRQSYN